MEADLPISDFAHRTICPVRRVWNALALGCGAYRCCGLPSRHDAVLRIRPQLALQHSDPLRRLVADVPPIVVFCLVFAVNSTSIPFRCLQGHSNQPARDTLDCSAKQGLGDASRGEN
jgi:hypothetical protein